MARTLTKTLARIRSEDPERGKRLESFYKDMRGSTDLGMLGTGSWRRAIEILDQYSRTGYYPSRHSEVIDFYDSWLNEVYLKPREIN